MYKYFRGSIYPGELSLRPHLKEIQGKKRAAGENFLENRKKMQEF